MPGRYYIAGPMRGIAYCNFPAFDAEALRLRTLGVWVVNPAELDRDAGFDPAMLPADTDWHDYTAMGFDLRAAVKRDLAAIMECDGVYMLPGWELSRGARAEAAVAAWLGLDVVFPRQ